MLITELAESILLLIRFRIRGNLRFLSHSETVSVLERSCKRADMAIRYSQGFNPHPKMSLPLPRSVGVESDDELLCLQIESSVGFDVEAAKDKLAQQSPEGLEVVSVEIAESKKTVQPSAVTYMLQLKQPFDEAGLEATIEKVLGSEEFWLTRQIDAKGNTRKVDVRGFIESFELIGDRLAVVCKVSGRGTIRVDEILQLLELEKDKLAAPIRRTCVRWCGN